MFTFVYQIYSIIHTLCKACGKLLILLNFKIYTKYDFKIKTLTLLH